MLPNSNSEIQGILDKLTRHFLRGSLIFSLNMAEIDILTPEVQEKFLWSTIHLDRFKMYPLNSNFCRIFFKKLLSYLERAQEIHDEMYLFLCTQMEKPPEKDEFCYRHYVIKNNAKNLITIKETKNMVVHGTTGMKTWEAAFMLSDWALCNEKILNNKKILELGSGVGFTGVAITKHCDIQSIILTDCHEEVLNNIKDNIKINFPDFREEKTSNMTMFTDEEKLLGVKMLDWNSTDDILDVIVPDIIIGADIVYDPAIFPALFNVIQYFFRKNNDLEIYIASVIRNEDTFNKFLDILDKSQLQYEEIFLLQPLYIEWDHTVKRKVLKIKY